MTFLACSCSSLLQLLVCWMALLVFDFVVGVRCCWICVNCSRSFRCSSLSTCNCSRINWRSDDCASRCSLCISCIDAGFHWGVFVLDRAVRFMKPFRNLTLWSFELCCRLLCCCCLPLRSCCSFLCCCCPPLCNCCSFLCCCCPFQWCFRSCLCCCSSLSVLLYNLR